MERRSLGKRLVTFGMKFVKRLVHFYTPVEGIALEEARKRQHVTHLVADVFHGVVNGRGFRLKADNLAVRSLAPRRVDVNVARLRPISVLHVKQLGHDELRHRGHKLFSGKVGGIGSSSIGLETFVKEGRRQESL